MNAIPSFSVIIPARNAAGTIEACIDSVLALDPPPVEVIVVDDASNDKTGSLAEGKGARVIRCDKNVGPGIARNIGAQGATGEVLAFTDSDCQVPRDWLSRFAAALAEGNHSGGTGPYAGATDRTLLTQLIDSTIRHSQRDLPAEIESSISSNLCVRKVDFDAVGGFPSYRLPWSEKCYWGNEDEEFGHVLTRKTGKPIRWLRNNGVYHGYRATVGGYFKQQAKYAEAILVSYARFPSMASGQSNYSRGGGATRVVAAWLALVSIALSPICIWTLLGVIPFVLSDAGTVLFAARAEQTARRRIVLALTCYPFLLLTALAWTKGLMTGAAKAAAGLVYWRMGVVKIGPQA